MASFKKYGSHLAGSPVRGEDAGSHPYNSKHLRGRPRMVYMGPGPQVPPTNDDWPASYYRRWPYAVGTSPQTVFTDSFTISKDAPLLIIHLCFIGTHVVESYIDESLEDLKDARTRAIMSVTARARQIGRASTNWSGLDADVEVASSYQQYYWPTTLSGRSRFLLQTRASEYESTKTSLGDGGRFTYREGQLYPEDYALIEWKTLELRLDQNFDPSLPIRLDISSLTLATTLEWGLPQQREGNLLRTYIVSSSVYEVL